MKFSSRFKKLTLWNKLGAWGSIASILGLLASIVAGLWFLLTPDHSELVVDSRIEFYNLYISDFNEFEMYEYSGEMIGSWPAKPSGKLRFFGLHSSVWVRINNTGEKATSVRMIQGGMAFGKYQSEVFEWYQYWPRDFSGPIRFPLYIKPQEEVVLIVLMQWPISGKLKTSFDTLPEQTHYTALQLTDALGIHMYGHPMGFEDRMRGVLLNDLREQFGADTSVVGQIALRIVTANKEVFTTSIELR